MSFKKIKDDNFKKECLSPQHYPPGNIVLEPGIYEWACPTCGKITRVSVPRITC